MPKKIIFILITVFVLAGVITLIVYFFAGNSNTAPSATNNTGTNYQTFNPFGSGTTTTPTANNQNTVTQTNETQQQTPTVVSKFHKITDFAVAGATYFEDTRPIATPALSEGGAGGGDQIQTTTPASTTPPLLNKAGTKSAVKTITTKPVQPKFEIVPSIRYVERVTGHIYEMYLDTKAINQISNSTIPSIYEAIFSGNAQTVIYRYLGADNKTISSYMATLGNAKGEFLPYNITDIGLSPDKSKFFYLIKNQNGTIGIIRSFTETKTSQVFNSPFTEWLPQWVTNQKVFLTTKASWSVNGDLFNLNTANGSMTKIFGGIAGLTTLANNDGTMVLYSVSLTNGPNLKIFDIKKHISNDINTNSLPEKCVWSNDNINIYCGIPKNITGYEYPDSWYQGLTSFDDYFVKINTATLQVEKISDGNDIAPADATHLFLDKGENNLFFINKKDSILWSFDLK
jgi:hypothetical protein